MAQRSAPLTRENTCSMCWSLLKDPVTTPCGHRFCHRCITPHWEEEGKNEPDGEDGEGGFSCPRCRKRSRSRPVLKKTGAEDVVCDVCTGRKLKARKSCLECLVSFCDNHLQPHRDVAQFRKHRLVEPTKNLQENVCPRHSKLMDIFCHADQLHICYLCFVEEHKDHDTVSAATRMREKLQETQQIIHKSITDREQHVKVLQQEVNGINLSADKAVEHSQKSYRDLILLMMRRSSDVKQQIRSQQEAEVRRVQDLQKKLKQEMAELRRKDAELQQLAHSKDPYSFLHNDASASHLPGSTHSFGVRIHPRRYFEDVTAAVSESSQRIRGLLRGTRTKISLTKVGVLRSEPKTRAEFLRYSRDVTLDPNTANRHLMLSEGNRRATWTKTNQPRPRHQGRFIDHCQVLSTESLTGRCYLEVKIREGRVKVAVACKNMRRAGDGNRFGHNEESWALECFDQSYRFWSNGELSPLRGHWSSTVGVYLDHPAGLLAFYSVSDTMTRPMTLLHRVQTSFTQPLHAGLWVYRDSSAELDRLG